jgi:hypothetical protein
MWEMERLAQMTNITADDIRGLARADFEDAALVLVDGRPEVVRADTATTADQIVYTKFDLVDEYGEEITDVEAELAAANLTAALAE